eukprot:184722-Hanusia_phi.AAC.3
MKNIVSDVAPADGAEIDWGDLDVGQDKEECGGIDWGEPEQGAVDGAIDWGDVEAVEGGGDSQQAAEIDWGEEADLTDITVEEDCAGGAGLEVESSPCFPGLTASFNCQKENEVVPGEVFKTNTSRR